MSKTVIFELGKAKASAFIGGASPHRPLEITAVHIPDGCQIQFDRVEYDDALTKETFACSVGDVYSTEAGRFPYKICECQPFIDSTVRTIYIDQPGQYVAVIAPETGCVGEILAFVREAPEMAGNITDKNRGCCHVPKADLQVTKSASKTRYKVGETVTYTMRWLNAGPSDATGSVLKDELPPDFTLTSATVAYSGGANGAGTLTAAQLASFQIGAMPVGSYADITVTGTFSKDGVFHNDVRVALPAGVEEIDHTNNQALVQVIIESLEPKLEIVKTVSDDTPMVGDSGQFVLTVTNAGVDAETNVSVKDVLPAGLAYVEPFTVAGGSVSSVTSAQLAGGVIVASALAAGGVVTITIPYVAEQSAAGRTLMNSASVKGKLSEDDDQVVLSVRLPAVDLVAEKTVSDQSPAVGDTVTWTATFTNDGPNAADGSVITEHPPVGLTFSVVALSYTGGANGPATSTMAAFEAGIAIPTLPSGGTVVATYSAVVPAGFENRTLLNSVSIAPPSGVEESNTYNNQASVTTTVQGACYLECCEELVRFSDGAAGAGVCVAWGSINYNPFRDRAVVRGRDLTFEEGSGTSSGATGSHLEVTVTNPYPCDAMLVVDLHAANNVFYLAGSPQGSKVGFVTVIGEQLNINMPAGGSADQNEIRMVLGTDVSTSTESGGSGTNYDERTGHGRYQKLLAPGQSVTLYAQWWAILSSQFPFLNSVLHGHMSVEWALHRNAVKV
jgi:uncharacterized repeat protein (TIGR01451 family)